MSDRHPVPTPPDLEPMDDATRARLRARVVDGLAEPGHPWPRRWLIPAAAAAVVLVVAGAAAGLALRDDPGSRGTIVDPAASLSPSPTPTPTPTDGTGQEPDDTTVSPDPTGGGAEPTPTDDSECGREVRGVVRGAEPVATTSSETGTTTFYVAGERWTLCSTHGGRATVHQPRGLTAPDDREAYGVSSVFSGRDTSTYVAGGVLPDGVTDADITYGYADGHREPATTVADDDGRTWWQMEYTVSGGVMNEGSSLDLDPITVDVAYGDVRETYELDWALDTCRQANHGC